MQRAGVVGNVHDGVILFNNFRLVISTTHPPSVYMHVCTRMQVDMFVFDKCHLRLSLSFGPRQTLPVRSSREGATRHPMQPLPKAFNKREMTTQV